MLHLVTQEDLKRLMACPEETVNASHYGLKIREALRVVLEIIRRLPEPRAYLIEPSHRPDRPQEMYLWELGKDLLSVYLNDRKISIVDPASLRQLLLFCPAFLYLLTGADPTADPLWLNLAAADAVQQVYIPRDGYNNKRHRHAQMRAVTRKIEVHEWHLANGLYSRPSQP